MINYTEKGSGLHSAIIAAGHVLRQENGIWVSTDDEVVQAIIDAYDPLAGAVTNKKAEIDAKAKWLRDKAVAGYSKGEIGKWEAKYRQAQAFDTSKNPDDAPDLVAEAGAAMSDVQTIASRVIAKGDMFSALEAKIAGTATRHKNIISAMTDFNEVINYDFSAWWD
ncbi:MAG: hypothetical protein V4447_10760 [Pseudomonadota bacterium]